MALESPVPTASAPKLKGTLRLAFDTGPAGRTRLRECFRSGLFHVGKTYEEEDGLTLQVLNPTAGIFEGDQLDSRVEVGPGAKVLLHAASSTRVYAMPGGGSASGLQTFTVASGGMLAWLPRSLVLHRGASFGQHTRIDLEAGASMFFLDLLSAGRRAYGELIDYELLDARMSIHLDGRPVVRERVRCGRDLNRWLWNSGGRIHPFLGTVYIAFPDAARVCTEAFSAAAIPPDLRVGFSALEDHLVVVRFMALDTPTVYNLLNDTVRRLRPLLSIPTTYQRIL